MEIKCKNSKLPQKQIVQQLCSSDSTSTSKKCRDQTNMPSSYNRKNNEGKKLSSQGGSVTNRAEIVRLRMRLFLMKN